MERINGLLTKECVQYRVDHLSVTSTQTPLVLFGFDPRFYSRNNWIGINPFAVVSGVDVRCESGENGLTKVIVRVNRGRAFLWAAYWIVFGIPVLLLPQPAGVIVFTVLSCTAWLGNVTFLAGYLISKEIADNLKDEKHLL